MKNIAVEINSNRSNTYSDGTRTSMIWIMPAMTIVYMLVIFLFGINSAHWKTLIISLAVSVGVASYIQILWLKLKSLGIALLLLFMPLFLIGTYLHPLAPIFTAILIAAFLSNLVRIRKLNLGQVGYILVAVLVSAGTLSLILFQRSGMDYAQPFMSLSINKDTLFHVAISSMLKNYGTASTGLYGLVPIHYHIASHSVFASLSLVTNLSVFDVYSYIYPLVFIPMMLAIFLCLAEEFLPSRTIAEWISRVTILAILLVGLDSDLFSRAAFWMSFYISESYTLALILLMGLLSLLIEREKISDDSKNILNTIFILLLFALTCLAKISVSFIFLGILGSWTLFGQASFFRNRLKLTAACFLVFIFIYKLALGSSISFDFFHFMKLYVVSSSITEKIIIYLIFHLFYTNLLLILNTHVRDNRLPLWLFFGILICTFMGVIPGALLAIPGGSAYYFSNVSQIIALPFLLILISGFLRKATKPIFDNNLSALKNIKLRLKHFILISKKIVSVATITMVILLAYFIFAFLPSSKKIFYSLSEFSSDMKSSLIPYNSYFVTELRKISKDPSTKNMIIYLPRNIQAFWKLDTCDKIGFVLPAIAERSSLRSLPDPSCGANNYGYESYQAELSERSQRLDSDDVLKQEAHGLGFNGVIVLDEKNTRILK